MGRKIIKPPRGATWVALIDYQKVFPYNFIRVGSSPIHVAGMAWAKSGREVRL